MGTRRNLSPRSTGGTIMQPLPDRVQTFAQPAKSNGPYDKIRGGGNGHLLLDLQERVPIVRRRQQPASAAAYPLARAVPRDDAVVEAALRLNGNRESELLAEPGVAVGQNLTNAVGRMGHLGAVDVCANVS